MMKRFLCAFAILMVFSFGLAQGQTSVSLSSPPATVYVGVLYDFDVNFTYITGDGSAVTGSTNGFRIWTTNNGLTGNYQSPVSYDTLPIPNGWGEYYDGGVFFNINPGAGAGDLVDTLGFGGFALFKPGLMDPFNQDVITIDTKCLQKLDTLCIDSSFYQPANSWLWSSNGPLGAFLPAWGGPYCWQCDTVINFPPDIDCVDLGVWDHCDLAVDTFTAVDPDGPPPITWSMVSGKGQIDANSGVWTYQPTLADVPGPHTVIVQACDGLQACAPCTTTVTFTNVAPTCQFVADTPLVGKGKSIDETPTAQSNDCDNISFFDGGASPTPDGGYSVDPSTGKLTFDAAMTDEGLYCFTVGVTDGKDTSLCVKCFEVVSILKWDVSIENKPDVYQGVRESISVVVGQGTERMGGFDFLVAYDASALIFIEATEGDIYEQCNWEYFTYRFGPFGNCGNQCPSGMLRVVGMAEINNGPYHPTCFRLEPCYTLFDLHFLITNDRTFECQYIPVRFIWFDCGDNTISSKDGDTLWVSKEIFNKGGGPQQAPVPGVCPNEEFEYIDITDRFWEWGYPTFTGVQDECLVDPDGQGPKLPPIPFINFFNGGFEIVCADSIDARGDINLNGLSNEIADAVMFTNYFIYGLSVFQVNMQGQIAATDVNNDGQVLTVGDLVYLIRIITGDALPYPKLSPVAATYTIDNGIITVDGEMGAAYVVVEGDVTPSLLVNEMELKYRYDAEANVTRMLVYSFEGNGFSGEFLNANGNVVSIELGSYEGAVVKATQLPVDFALNQNYPNPFNPVTTISFNLPVASDYTLTIYNVTGQQVAEFSNTAEAGTVSIEMDASSWASGVYFYKLNAGDFSDTKKMVLLK